MTLAERRLAAQITANTRWSRPGARRAASERASRSLYTRFEKEIDAEAAAAGAIPPPDERHALVQARLRAYMANLSLKAAKARARKQARAQRNIARGSAA